MNTELCARTARALRAAAATPHSLTAMVGFDGFVDEIIRVVDKRSSATEYSQVERISDLAARIGAASGQSANIELIVERVKLGGNGPIMANALAALGPAVTCIGPLGAPAIHPAFAPMQDHAALISLGEPAHTDALEFEDGKLMLGKMESLGNVTWDRLIEKIGAGDLARLLTESSLVAVVNWTMIPAMSDIWGRMLDLLERLRPTVRTRARFFFDLADPEKHSAESIAAACHLLARFQDHAPTVLGLNEKEAFQVAGVLGYNGPGHGRDHVRAVAEYISAQLPIETVVVHPRAYAVSASGGEITSDVDGPFVEDPKISTGAGDHFNAGFCLGKLLGLSDEQCTTVGVGTSGYYVRTAVSPTLLQLAEFLS